MQHPQKRTEQKKKNPEKNRKRILLFVGIALLLSLASVLLLPVIKASFPGASQAPSPLVIPFETLDAADRELLSEITVRHRDGESYTLSYQNGDLYLNGEGGKLARINESHADDILKAATLIAVEEVVTRDVEEVRQHLPDMGLEPSEISVRVRYQNGREDSIDLGYNVPGTTYHYYRWSGDPGIYMCDAGAYEAFEYTAQMLLPVSQPVLEKTLIDHITLRLKDQEPFEVQFSTDGAGHTAGTLKHPYVYPLDATSAEALLTAASNFRLGTKQGEVTTENLSDYGFDDPLAVIDIHQQAGAYGEIDENGALITQSLPEQTLSIVLGRKEGNYFFTCEYGGECYLVSNFLVAPLLPSSLDTIISQTPANLGDVVITGIQVQLGGQMLDIRQHRTERVLEDGQLATDESGNILYDVTITKNGEPMPEEAFTALVSRLKVLQVSGNVEPGFNLGASTPRWQLSITTLGGLVRTLAAYPMDTFFDALAVDGTVKHSLQAESIHIALADLMSE